ncbi:unnamed protein product, partial [Staurois parvus]
MQGPGRADIVNAGLCLTRLCIAFCIFFFSFFLLLGRFKTHQKRSKNAIH